MVRWRPLLVLSAMQFLMVIDTSVMNVSISQLVDDFDTSVAAIQGVITLYSLVMAALMIAGGKAGDIVGRRRVLVIGLCCFAAGSALTTVSWSVASLAFGWSILEGVGAALVLPAMATLIAGSYRGTERVTAFGIMGGTAGAAVALGPIIGGWVTTQWSWRYVFGAEAVLAVAIVLASRFVTDVPKPVPAPRLDVVGAVLSALGMALTVLGMLMASTWGWLVPLDSPVTPFGYSLTPFLIAAGIAVLYLFRWWEHRRERGDADPLVRLALLRIASLRSGLATLLAMNVVFMGIFFILPLYLQIVLGLNAFQTGERLLPMSLMMLVVSFCGSLLLRVLSPRAIVRIGLAVMVAATMVLLATIEPRLEQRGFAASMALLGMAMGLLASQLGNVILSSVGPESRSEAGGLQYTAQQLGGAIGVALIGSIVMTGLVSASLDRLDTTPGLSAAAVQAAQVQLSSGARFVSTAQAQAAAQAAGFSGQEAAELVQEYEQAELEALRAGLLAAAGVAALALLTTRGLPTGRRDELASAQGANAGGDPATLSS